MLRCANGVFGVPAKRRPTSTVTVLAGHARVEYEWSNYLPAGTVGMPADFQLFTMLSLSR